MSYEFGYEGNVLKVRDLNLSFNDTTVLRNVNLSIENVVRPGMSQGQIVALLGPSGIGKTQLLRCICGLQSPTSGKVTLGPNDVDVSQGLVGLVPQSYPLFNNYTVLRNLTVAARQAGLSKAQATEKANSLLDTFNLREKANVYPANLSGGQRQRVAIAQQLICSEHVILMDEPFASLDPLMVDKTIDLIQAVALLDEWNTFLISTHEISTAIAIADTLLIMGRERDASGNVIPGAFVKHQYDLIKEGLAWRPEIRSMPRFQQLATEVRALFKTL